LLEGKKVPPKAAANPKSKIQNPKLKCEVGLAKQ
jgi:hypothetical protein